MTHKCQIKNLNLQKFITDGEGFDNRGKYFSHIIPLTHLSLFGPVSIFNACMASGTIKGSCYLIFKY